MTDYTFMLDRPYLRPQIHHKKVYLHLFKKYLIFNPKYPIHLGKVKSLSRKSKIPLGKKLFILGKSIFPIGIFSFLNSKDKKPKGLMFFHFSYKNLIAAIRRASGGWSNLKRGSPVCNCVTPAVK